MCNPTGMDLQGGAGCGSLSTQAWQNPQALPQVTRLHCYDLSRSRNRDLPLFIEIARANCFFGKCRDVWLPRLGSGRDAHYCPVAESREEQVIESGKFLFVESVAAVQDNVMIPRFVEWA